MKQHQDYRPPAYYVCGLAKEMGRSNKGALAVSTEDRGSIKGEGTSAGFLGVSYLEASRRNVKGNVTKRLQEEKGNTPKIGSSFFVFPVQHQYFRRN